MSHERLLTRAIMSHPVETIPRGASALAAAERMSERRVLHLVVVDPKGRVQGVLSDRDLRSAQPSQLLVPDPEMRKKALAILRVEDIMTTHPSTIHDDEPVEDALNDMLKRRLGCLPVVDRTGNLVGIVTGGDVTKLALQLVRERGHDSAPPVTPHSHREPPQDHPSEGLHAAREGAGRGRLR